MELCGTAIKREFKKDTHGKARLKILSYVPVGFYLNQRPPTHRLLTHQPLTTYSPNHRPLTHRPPTGYYQFMLK